tara:strand:+ start:248 stop:631 length:384 start_codon:yes stop_codon:yes gene_type:complete
MNQKMLRLAIRGILRESLLTEEEELGFDPSAPLPFSALQNPDGEFVGPPLPVGYGTVLADPEEAEKPPEKRKVRQKAAKNWEEYVKLTVIQYKEAEVDGEPVDEEYVQEFVDTYTSIIARLCLKKTF